MDSWTLRGTAAGTPLRDATLAHHSRRVVVPRYDRKALTPAVVHVGVGAFHRSHQAAYFDDLAQQGVSLDWGLTGVGLRSREMKAALTAQDGLYTLVERGARRDRPRVIGVLTRYLLAPEDPCGVMAALTDRRTRLVTLTVTGCAYSVDGASGGFDPSGPGVLDDVLRPGRPGTVLGYLVEALARRRRAGVAPFTVLSCDNLEDNGATARTALVSFAALRDDRLAEWIDRNVGFPSSMVDRITPQTTPADRMDLERVFGVQDRWPVITEPFRQWIVEDEFSGPRPPLDEVGVRYVSDVRPYARVKTRLLNASHSALGYLGYLMGHRRIDQAMGDPVLARYIERLMDEEVTPLLPPVPGIDLAGYKGTLLERFRHPKLGDQLSRLCRSGSTKVPAHVLSSIAEAREQDRPCGLLTLAVAAWVRYLRGVDESGAIYAIDDPVAGRLRSLARIGGSDPRPLLGERCLFGDLADDPGFVASLERALQTIDEIGTAAAVELYLTSDAPLAA